MIYDLMNLNNKQQSRPLNLKKSAGSKIPPKTMLHNQPFNQNNQDDVSHGAPTQATT
jgi:hypothetical protein